VRSGGSGGTRAILVTAPNGACRKPSRARRHPVRDDAACSSHPDCHRRSWNFTKSTGRWLRSGRGLSPPVRTLTDPGARVLLTLSFDSTAALGVGVHGEAAHVGGRPKPGRTGAAGRRPVWAGRQIARCPARGQLPERTVGKVQRGPGRRPTFLQVRVTGKHEGSSPRLSQVTRRLVRSGAVHRLRCTARGADCPGWSCTCTAASQRRHSGVCCVRSPRLAAAFTVRLSRVNRQQPSPRAGLRDCWTRPPAISGRQPGRLAEGEAFRDAGPERAYPGPELSPPCRRAGTAAGPVRQFRISRMVTGEARTVHGGHAWLTEAGVEVPCLTTPSPRTWWLRSSPIGPTSGTRMSTSTSTSTSTTR